MPRFVIHADAELKLDDVRDDITDVIADYGNSLLADATNEQIQQLRDAGYRIREISVEPGVKVNCYRLNTSMNAAHPSVARSVEFAEDTLDDDTSAMQHVIVQMVGPMHPNWAKDLKSLEAKKYSSLENHAHLIGIPAAKLSELEAKDYVISVSDYMPQLKVSEQLMSPRVHSEFPSTEALSLVGDLSDSRSLESPGEDLRAIRGAARAPSRQLRANLRVVLFEQDDVESVLQKLQAMHLDVAEIEADSLLVAARAEKISQIAAIPEVRMVESNQQRVLQNRVATGVTRADVLQNTFGLDGSGEIVAVADSGLDTGVAATVSDDFNGRTRAIQALGRPGLANDPDGHGTHVAGSVLGNGTNSRGNIRGMAPNAELVFQSVLDEFDGLGGLSNLKDVFQKAFDEDARIHNNSWGFGRSDGVYNTGSRNTDEFAFDHRDFLVVFSAGNDSPLNVNAPASAKNVLTVGASESLQQLPASVSFPPSPRFPSGPTLSGLDQDADNLNDIADFSCHGPVQENRRKPDVVAPGSWILSARSTVMVADTGPDGLSGLPETPSFPNGGTGDEDGVPTHDEAIGRGLPGQPIMGAGSVNTPGMPAGSGAGSEEFYMYQSGTSMASPIVAGCCALVRQHIQQGGHVPSAALIKALLVNGAQNIRAQAPSNDQGWGRVDLVETIRPAGGAVQFDDDINRAVGTFDIREYVAPIADPNEPMTVTLVWRDAAGPTIQNKLHLRVFNGASSVALTSDPANDIRNNVQKVIVKGLTNTLIRIEVEGVDITTGIPEVPGSIVQDFALVVGNTQALASQ